MRPAIASLALCMLALLTAPGLTQTPSLEQTLRRGDLAAARRAASATTEVDIKRLGSLLMLVRAGANGEGTAAITAELARAVLGWWSMQDADVAQLLYDASTDPEWQSIGLDLLQLAAIGIGDGTAHANALLSDPNPGWHPLGLFLLRKVGADNDTIDATLDRALSGDAELQQLGLILMWEFEVASPAWTRRLEALHDERDTDEATRWTIRWSLAHTGGFRTAWMLETRAQLRLSEDQQHFDTLFESMVPRAARRLLTELPQLAADERKIAATWLTDHLRDPDLRRKAEALPLGPTERCHLFATAFAQHGLGDAALLDFWVRCLAGSPRLQRFGCLGLAHLQEAARPHLNAIASTLTKHHENEPFRHWRVAAALHALGAAGASAHASIETVTQFLDDDNEYVTAAAAWALPRIRGEAPAGPIVAQTPRPMPFEPDELRLLAGRDSWVVGHVPEWPEELRVLAVPRVLMRLLDDAPNVPPTRKAIAVATTPMQRVTALDPLAAGLLMIPEEISWHDRHELRVAALRSIGPRLAAARPLLEWLAPRRPGINELLDERK